MRSSWQGAKLTDFVDDTIDRHEWHSVNPDVGRVSAFCVTRHEVLVDYGEKNAPNPPYISRCYLK